MGGVEMDCSQMAARLTDLMEGDLEAEAEAAALEHLATCSACETVLSETQDVVSLARNHGREPLSEESRSEIWNRVIGDAEDSANS